MTADRSPRILICRLSAVGDCILTMPLLCALRERFPSAYLAWVVERGAAPLLEDHPCLDRLIVLKKGWLKSMNGVSQLRRQLRELDFDVALDPQSLTKSALVGWLSGAPRRIGFQKPRGREFSVLLNNQLVAQHARHLVDCQLGLLKPLDVENPRVLFRVPHDEAAEERIASFICGAHLSGGFVVMNPGAGWDSRLWPPARFGTVARTLGERRQLPSLVVWAGDRERDWAREIVAKSGGHAVLGPATSLRELAAVMRRGSLFVGSDTGPLHLAAAVGTPCVGLHGTTRHQESGAYGLEHIAIQHHFQAGSSRQRRRADNEAMRAIQVEPVIAACEQILDRRADPDALPSAA